MIHANSQLYSPAGVLTARPAIWSVVALLAGALMLAVVLGLLAGIGNVLISGALLSLVGIAVATGSPRVVFWFAVIGSLVAAGLLELYLPGLQVLRWAFAGSTALFLAAVMLARFGRRAAAPTHGQPLLTWAMLGFIVVFMLSLIANWRGGVASVIGIKNYFQAWALFFGLAFMLAWPGIERSLPRLLLIIGVLQLPFVLHQFLVLAPQRAAAGGLTPVDVVAGTFGASIAGGGNNAALAMFLIVVAAVFLSLWRTGAVRARALWLLPPLLLPIFLNESKVSVVYLVLAFMIVFRREILKRPVRFIALALAVTALGFGLILSYSALHQSSRFNTASELVEHVLRQNTQEGERYGTQLLNRTTSLTHWAEERRHYPLAKALIGHGPSESKLAVGLLDAPDNLSARRYPGQGIGVTAISSLLWDFGVVGLLSVLWIYFTAFRLAGRLARDWSDAPYHNGLFLGLQAGVAVLALSLLHKASFTYQLGYQVFTLLVLGFLVTAWRWLPAHETTRKQGRHRP